jgi:hypothetical protein
MPRVSVIDQIPSPLVGEGQGEGPAASAVEEFVTPLSQPSPTRGEGLKRLSLAPEAIDKARYVRRSMTDAERTRFFEDQGYRVLRFWNNDVLNNTDGVLERIAQEISRP